MKKLPKFLAMAGISALLLPLGMNIATAQDQEFNLRCKGGIKCGSMVLYKLTASYSSKYSPKVERKPWGEVKVELVGENTKKVPLGTEETEFTYKVSAEQKPEKPWTYNVLIRTTDHADKAYRVFLTKDGKQISGVDTTCKLTPQTIPAQGEAVAVCPYVTEANMLEVWHADPSMPDMYARWELASAPYFVKPNIDKDLQISYTAQNGSDERTAVSGKVENGKWEGTFVYKVKPAQKGGESIKATPKISIESGNSDSDGDLANVPAVEVQTLPKQPDPGKPDPGKTDPGKTDPGKVDPGKVDPAKPDPGKVDPDPGKADLGKGKGDAGKESSASKVPSKVTPSNKQKGAVKKTADVNKLPQTGASNLPLLLLAGSGVVLAGAALRKVTA